MRSGTVALVLLCTNSFACTGLIASATQQEGEKHSDGGVDHPIPVDPREPPLEGCEAVTDADARAVFETHCTKCHGDGPIIEGGLRGITNLRGLIDRGLIVPFESDASRIYGRIQRGEMPPPGEPDPPEAAAELLKTWIDCGARFAEEPPPSRPTIHLASRIALMRADIDAASAGDRANTRYVVLTHLYNAGASDEKMDGYREALSFAINSTSTADVVAQPLSIDAERTVYRIDLRDYGWDASTWARVEQEYPYAVDYARESEEYGYDSVNDAALRESTGTSIPWVYADWLIGQGMRPPLYYDLLRLGSTLGELATQIDLPYEANIAEGRVHRAGFAESGVSFNNRVIERHDLPGAGAFWRSYDFRSSVGVQSVFAHPLDFVQDGGEMIFTLPNGLQAYFLTDGVDGRINAGPQDVVFDPSRPSEGIEAGVSCMGCHDAEGIIPKSDEIRAFALTRLEDATLRDRVAAVYVERDELEQLRVEDARRFRNARRETGVQDDRIRPISYALGDYEARVDLTRAAATLGLSAEELANELAVNASNFPIGIASLASPGAVLRREVFEQEFAEAVCAITSRGRFGAPIQCEDPVVTCVCPAPLSVVIDDVSTGEDYEVIVAQQGRRLYTDRGFEIVELGSALLGGAMIRTANDDKYVAAETHLTFTVNVPVTLFVAYDNRAETLPAWLDDGTWTLTDETFTASERDGVTRSRRVYSKTIDAGEIRLGGNATPPAAPEGINNYVIVVQP